MLELTKKVEAAIQAEEFDVPIRVAVMGCVVNGPGEAREADVGTSTKSQVCPFRRSGEAEGSRGRAGTEQSSECDEPPHLGLLLSRVCVSLTP